MPGDGRDDGPTSSRRGRRVLLAGVVVVPWLVVGVLMLIGGRPATTRLTPDAPRAEPVDDGRRTADDAIAGPVAVRLVRDAVTSTGDGTATALDAAAAEPPDPLGDDLWIVRVHAVVLHGDRRRWRSASHEIWAVPVGRRNGAVVGLDHPWRVADGADRIVDTAWEPAAVDLDEVRTALRRAGIPAVADLRAERHPQRVALLRAVIGAGPHQRHVWLRTTPVLEVLGHLGSTPEGS